MARGWKAGREGGRGEEESARAESEWGEEGGLEGGMTLNSTHR